MKFKTIVGTVSLTAERKIHITQRHPIMDDYLVHIKGILEYPDDIRYSNYSNSILLFYLYFDKIEGGKYMAVVVNTKDLQIKTAYLTNRIKSGRKYVKE